MQLALYRKYRPEDFKDMVGQNHIATTLENAIKSGKFSHAYLFSGPRGVGKTSAARILARRINKLKPTESASHLDVIEIDAASNRGIEDIRSLREKVHIAPASGEFKVYIIDEVHMLTNDAFGGLLKTLEEPPAHAIFVLATTEPHKLPETIISRTQRYNFHPVATAELVKHLTKLAKAEGLQLDTAAAELIATSSEGSVRDALSMLDQAANLSGNSITQVNVSQMLGLIDNSLVEQLLAELLNGNSAGVVAQLSKYRQLGGTPAQLLRQLLQSLHQMLRARIGTSAQLSDQLLAASMLGSTSQIVSLVKSLAQLPANSPHLEIALEATLLERCLPTPPTLQTQAQAQPKPIAKTQPIAKPASVPASSKPAANKPADASNDNNWAKVLTKVKQQNNSLYALLRSATTDVTGGAVTVQFRFQFHLRRLEETRNRQLLETSIKAIYGADTKLSTVLIKSTSNPSEDETKENKQAVDSVLQILGGEVIGG